MLKSRRGNLLVYWAALVLIPSVSQLGNAMKHQYSALRHRSQMRLCVETLEHRRVLAGAISGEIWNDWNRDGHRASADAEYRLAEIPVVLFSADLKKVAETTTDRKGEYRFDDIESGDYVIEFIVPDDVIFTDPDNDNADKNSDVDPKTSRTGTLRVRDGKTIKHVDAGVYSPFGTDWVSGIVWNDLNVNGVRDHDEPRLAGAEVQLENRLTKSLLSVFTDSEGGFRIDGTNLVPGQYVLDFKRPNREDSDDPEWQISPRYSKDAPESTSDSDAGELDGKTEAFTLRSVDDGNTPNIVRLDGGFFQSAQISGVVWHDVNRTGAQSTDEFGVADIVVHLLSNQNEVIQTTTTKGDGSYRFAVHPGEYVVEFDLIDGQEFAPRDVGLDTLDSDVNPTTGRTDTLTISSSEGGHHVSAGIYSATGTQDLVGRVWHDLNANGIQDRGEPSLSGVQVELENLSYLGLMETQTDAQGRFTISGESMLPGEYYLEFSQPKQAGEWRVSPRNITGKTDSDLDNDAQSLNGKTTGITLIASHERARGRTVRDAGFFQNGGLFGSVWNDLNKDGIRAFGEQPVFGATIHLINANGEIVATDRSDENGNYLFSDVTPGEYRLQMERPVGTSFSPVTNGHADLANQFYDNTAETSPITIESNVTVQRSAGVYGSSDRTMITGTVWNDANGNGIREPNEPLFPGIDVHLVGQRGDRRWVQTNRGGIYEFIDLEPGGYHLEFGLPRDSTFSPRSVAGHKFDSDVNRWTGRTKSFALLAGQVENSFDAGIYQGVLSANVVDSLRVTEVSFIGHGATEFVEFKNIGDQPIDLTGVRFEEGIRFDFSDRLANSLFPGEHVVVVSPDQTLEDRFDVHDINIAGQYEKKLDRDERLRIVDRDGKEITSFRYDDDWFVLMDQEYQPWTLTIVDEKAPGESWKSRGNWRPSSVFMGTPGFDDPRLTPDPGDLIINEVLAKSSDGFNDQIEIHNTTDHDIDIGYWFLGDHEPGQEKDTYLRRYRISPGTVVPAQGFLVFSREQNFSNPRDPGQNSDFGLSSFGEWIHLVAADQYGQFLGFSDSVSFSGSQTDVSFGRVQIADGSYAFSPMTEKTFGAKNSSPLVGPLVIDQVMYYGLHGTDYIRLQNTSDDEIELHSESGRWQIGGGIQYDFQSKDGQSASIPANGWAFVVPHDPARFRIQYGIPSDVPVFGPYHDNLDRAGENVQLFRFDEFDRRILVDQVHYDNEYPWPESASQGDVALLRSELTSLGDDPDSWTTTENVSHSHLHDGHFLRQVFVTSASAIYGSDVLGVGVVQSRPGDANGDGVFDSRDLVSVFTAGLYREDAIAGWQEGDWNGDERFDERDLVFAFRAGGFLHHSTAANVSLSDAAFAVVDLRSKSAKPIVRS